jgi:hypothetical protein
MAHFAKIEDGVVTQVIVVDNKDCADATGVEKESIRCSVLRKTAWRHMEADQLQRLHPQELRRTRLYLQHRH